MLTTPQRKKVGFSKHFTRLRTWTDALGSEQGQAAYACECGNEPSGSIKCGEFLD
jgi:hypothetical protein